MKTTLEQKAHAVPADHIPRMVTLFVQEILLMLDEYWKSNPDVQRVPIYQASGLAMKALSVYQTYIEMMNDDVKKAFKVVQLVRIAPDS